MLLLPSIVLKRLHITDRLMLYNGPTGKWLSLEEHTLSRYLKPSAHLHIHELQHFTSRSAGVMKSCSEHLHAYSTQEQHIFFSKECLLFNLYVHSLIKSISAWRVRSWTRSPRLVVSSFNHFLLTKNFDVSCIHACCDSLLLRNIVESIKKRRKLMHLWIHMERFKSANFPQEITYKRYLYIKSLLCYLL